MTCERLGQPHSGFSCGHAGLYLASHVLYRAVQVSDRGFQQHGHVIAGGGGSVDDLGEGHVKGLIDVHSVAQNAVLGVAFRRYRFERLLYHRRYVLTVKLRQHLADLSKPVEGLLHLSRIQPLGADVGHAKGQAKGAFRAHTVLQHPCAAVGDGRIGTRARFGATEQ